jgi:hypothetical protein
MLPIMALLTVMGGTMGGKTQAVAYFAMMGATALLLIIAIAATIGVEGQSSISEWTAAFTVTILYGMAVWGVQFDQSQRQTQHDVLEVKQWDQANAQAAQAISTLRSCLFDYAREHPERGYPASMKELTVGEPRCLDPAIAAGEAGAIRVQYAPTLPDASGIVRAYTACAEPVKFGAAGIYTVVVDETGETRKIFPSMSHGAASDNSCREAWADDFVRAIKFCTARWAAADRLCDEGNALACRSFGQYENVVHNEFPMHSETVAYAQHAFERGCDLADGESCFELARLAARGENPTPETKPLFERACTAHSGAACATLAQALGSAGTDARVEHYLTVGCDDGDPTSCTKLADLVEARDPERAYRLMLKGCAVKSAHFDTICDKYW